MPLVAPLPVNHDPEVTALAELYQETLGFTPNSVLTMQRRPAIAQAFIALNRAVMTNHGRVSNELKRLVALIASSAQGCRYCQAHTALAASRYGASRERLKALWRFRESELFDAAEKAALEFALAAASVPCAVDERIAETLRQHWDDGEVIELLAVISLFGFLNRWNDAMGTTLESAAAAHATDLLSANGWQAGKHA